MTAQVIANIIVTGSLYALAGVGFSLAFNTARFFNFSFGAIIALGGYTAHLLLTEDTLLLAPILLVALLGVGIFGALLDVAIFRRLRRRGASNLIFLLASLGLLVVIQNLLSVVFGDGTMSFWALNTYGDGLVIFGARITRIQAVSVILCNGFIFFTWLFMKATKLGKLILAVSNNPELSAIVGVNVDRVIVAAFYISSICAASVGLFIAMDVGMTPTMGFRPLLMAVVATIIGGGGSIPGIVVGGFFIASVQHLVAWGLSTQWQDAIVFLILLVFLFIRPRGLIGRKNSAAGI